MSTAEDRVVVKNVYYMMAYAFRALDVREFARLEAEEFDNFADLMAAILVLGISTQRKRGLERGYEEVSEDAFAVKGHIDVRGTMHLRSQRRSEVACSYDELTANTYKNRILKTCAELLMACDDVRLQRRRELKRCLVSMADVECVDPHHIEWARLRYHRNNGGYRVLMSVCYLVVHGFLLSEQAGEHRLAQFGDGRRLHALFENFVFEYFRREHGELSVRAKTIDRGAESDIPTFLPQLCTDITLQRDESVLIIDTKCYGNILHAHFDGKILSSAHLNQIQSYVIHEAYANPNEKVQGMLLYALTDCDAAMRESWDEIGHAWHCWTLDLGCEFKEIARQLDEIAAMI